jgi:hypothetical protein
MDHRTPRVRNSPQMSLMLLGEYMSATFSRKRAILREAKYPKDFIVPQYDPVQKAASRYLAHGGGDRAQLTGDIDTLLTGSSKSRWFQMRDKLCQQAISCLLALESELKLEELDVTLGNDFRHRLTLAGVTVSIYPDILLRGIDSKGPFAGALKFRYGKTKAVTDEWGAASATILHLFTEQHLAGEEVRAERRHCRVVDVFAGKPFVAPESFKRRRKDIEAACWNIKNIWDHVSPSD